MFCGGTDAFFSLCRVEWHSGTPFGIESRSSHNQPLTIKGVKFSVQIKKVNHKVTMYFMLISNIIKRIIILSGCFLKSDFGRY